MPYLSNGDMLSPSILSGERIIGWTPSLRFIDPAHVTAAPGLQSMMDQLQARPGATQCVAMGAAQGPPHSRRNVVRRGESLMGNLIADAMRQDTGADSAIVNGGGMRAGRTHDAGTTLTRRGILSELPFGSATVMTDLPRSQVSAALENGVSREEEGDVALSAACGRCDGL
jgi:5'-nucleotidase/UDP-sugar diphosphatase